MRDEGPIGPFGAVAIGLGALFLVAAVVWPRMAGSLLRAFLVVLALVWVGRRVFELDLPGRALLEDFTPFDGVTDPRTSAIPDGLYNLTLDLRVADDPERLRRALVPTSVRETLRYRAEQRLSEGYGLRLDDPEHHPRIRARLSEPTWELIAPRPADAGRHDDIGGVQQTVTLARLEHVLDDLEKL